MDEPDLHPEAKDDADMILREAWVMTLKPKMRKRWRRNAERLLAKPAPNPKAREQSAVWIRGLFERGRRLRT